MPNLYRSIGFPVETVDELEQLLGRVAPRATEIRVRRGKYLCWAPGSGEELWLQVDRRKQVFAVNPHFSGSPRVRVGLVELIQESEYSARRRVPCVDRSW